MSQISFSDLVNGTVPDASDFNDRFNALKNRINNGLEQDNIATGAVTKAKILDNAVDADKIDETDDYTWTGTQDFSGATIVGLAQANGMLGSYKNLAVIRPGVTSVDINADFLIVWDSSNNAKMLSAVDLTANITASGANGLDTGSEASGTWYYIWVVYNGTTVASLLSTSSTSPTLPSGYTYKALVSAVRNDGSSNFVNFIQSGNEYWYSSWQTAASGNVGGGAWTAIDTTSYVPSALSNITFGMAYRGGSGNTNIANDNTISATLGAQTPNRVNVPVVVNAEAWYKLNIITANTLYWQSDNANGGIYIAGFIVTKL